jgi:hypothetical protein
MPQCLVTVRRKAVILRYVVLQARLSLTIDAMPWFEFIPNDRCKVEHRRGRR